MIQELLVEPGTEVPTGTVLALIGEDGAAVGREAREGCGPCSCGRRGARAGAGGRGRRVGACACSDRRERAPPARLAVGEAARRRARRRPRDCRGLGPGRADPAEGHRAREGRGPAAGRCTAAGRRAACRRAGRRAAAGRTADRRRAGGDAARDRGGDEPVEARDPARLPEHHDRPQPLGRLARGREQEALGARPSAARRAPRQGGRPRAPRVPGAEREVGRRAGRPERADPRRQRDLPAGRRPRRARDPRHGHAHARRADAALPRPGRARPLVLAARRGDVRSRRSPSRASASGGSR